MLLCRHKALCCSMLCFRDLLSLYEEVCLASNVHPKQSKTFSHSLRSSAFADISCSRQ